MLRFDYTFMPDGTMVNVTVVEEGEDIHSLCGRLVMSSESFHALKDSLEYEGLRDEFTFVDKNENKV